MVPLLDELGSGIAPAATPDIASELHFQAGAGAGWIVASFGALALFVEVPLLAWIGRRSMRRVSSAALLTLALALSLAALAQTWWALALALALYGPASGVALTVAEGAAVEARAHERERVLARFMWAAELGDLLVPALLGALAWVGLGWRAALGVAALAAAALALVHSRLPILEGPLDAVSDEEGEAEEPSLREAARTAWRNRPLLGWSLLAALTNVLDEVLVALAVVHLGANLHASSALRAGAVAVWTLGGLAGLWLLDRALARADAAPLLVGASLLSAVSLCAFASLGAAPSADAWVHGAALGSLFVLGAASSSLHPLLKARAYAALPGRPSLVNAVASALAPLDVAAPLGLAALAAFSGVRGALVCIAIAPLLIALGSASSFRSARRRASSARDR